MISFSLWVLQAGGTVAWSQPDCNPPSLLLSSYLKVSLASWFLRIVVGHVPPRPVNFYIFGVESVSPCCSGLVSKLPSLGYSVSASEMPTGVSHCALASLIHFDCFVYGLDWDFPGWSFFCKWISSLSQHHYWRPTFPIELSWQLCQKLNVHDLKVYFLLKILSIYLYVYSYCTSHCLINGVFEVKRSEKCESYFVLFTSFGCSGTLHFVCLGVCSVNFCKNKQNKNKIKLHTYTIFTSAGSGSALNE